METFKSRLCFFELVIGSKHQTCLVGRHMVRGYASEMLNSLNTRAVGSFQIQVVAASPPWRSPGDTVTVLFPKNKIFELLILLIVLG